MSNKRYLEIDSTYRNREQYPNPSNFQVLISQSGTRDASQAFDPVSNASPDKTWIPDNLVLGATVPTFVSEPTNTPGEFIMTVPVGSDVSKIPNYYSGYPISVATPGVAEIVKITSWTYVSTTPGVIDSFVVTVSPDFSVVPEGAVTFAPSGTVNDFTNGTVFIPDGFTANHFYVNYILYNESISISSTTTQNNWRTIISYDGLTKIAGIDLSQGLVDPATPGGDTWLTSHTYSIRKIAPQFVGMLTVVGLPQPPNTSTKFTVPSDTIVRVGDFIRFTSGSNNDISCRVTAYTGDGNPATLTTPEIFPNIVTVSCILDPVPTTETFEVLQFTRDNAVPFSYTGSLVSQQEMVCYEIELINLILPNIILQSGGRTAFYPYVYVELQNVSSASAGTQGVIYSNNPNSKRMLFRAAIDDIPNPLLSPFIKIDGDGMVQTVKFKPNDNFKFGVYLPNGDPLETVSVDLFSPSTPNPLVQISAVFSFRRL